MLWQDFGFAKTTQVQVLFVQSKKLMASIRHFINHFIGRFNSHFVCPRMYQ